MDVSLDLNYKAINLCDELQGLIFMIFMFSYLFMLDRYAAYLYNYRLMWRFFK